MKPWVQDQMDKVEKKVSEWSDAKKRAAGILDGYIHLTCGNVCPELIGKTIYRMFPSDRMEKIEGLKLRGYLISTRDDGEIYLSLRLENSVGITLPHEGEHLYVRVDENES